MLHLCLVLFTFCRYILLFDFDFRYGSFLILRLWKSTEFFKQALFEKIAKKSLLTFSPIVILRQDRLVFDSRFKILQLFSKVASRTN